LACPAAASPAATATVENPAITDAMVMNTSRFIKLLLLYKGLPIEIGTAPAPPGFLS
jgi:hypothetical protein